MSAMTPDLEAMMGLQMPLGEPALVEGRDIDETEPDRALVLLSRPGSRAAAAFRAMAAKVRAANARSVAVAGVARGDGASVTAANLALALAEGGGRRVCLVDLDLASGAQNRLFGLEPREGLTELAATDGQRRPVLA